jgi:ribosome-binding factor A
MRQAKVHVSVMGSEKKQQLCLNGLESSAGFLQQKVGKRIDTRYTPRLKFKLDMGVKKSLAIAKMLNDVLPADDLATTEEVNSPDDDLAADIPDDGVPDEADN